MRCRCVIQSFARIGVSLAVCARVSLAVPLSLVSCARCGGCCCCCCCFESETVAEGPLVVVARDDAAAGRGESTEAEAEGVRVCAEVTAETGTGAAGAEARCDGCVGCC